MILIIESCYRRISSWIRSHVRIKLLLFCIVILTVSLFIVLAVYGSIHYSSHALSLQSLPIKENTSMNEQTPSTPSASQLEAFTHLENGDFQIRAGFRTADAEILAGGPLVVEFLVENMSRTPLHLAVGGDRARNRPSFFAFSATLSEADLELSDPAIAVPDLGGPIAIITIEEGAPFHQRLLVNQFLGLEQLRSNLAVNEVRILSLHCSRLLPLALDDEHAIPSRSNTPLIDSVLNISVRRDDAALETLIAHLANEVRASQTPNATGEREFIMSQLVALRNRSTIPALKMLASHTDPIVRMMAEQALKSFE
jgi:hypothetical protein